MVAGFRFITDRPRNPNITVPSDPRFRLRFASIINYELRNWDLVNWVGSRLRYRATPGHPLDRIG